MSYQVLARKWRPQRFDDVVGQPAVTRTLKNAIASGRIAQAFVFAGPRGVGKTTTARILARALSCAKGPTADPCGECDACREIAEGRDIDVLEIDAATHTGVENVREVIINGLSIVPVRNRYKVFIIDEVHQLSSSSFNALLKSIEEPPPHVVFMMATTELAKIPETVLSRSQVFEFKTISSKQIADQLRTIAKAEKIAADEAALLLIARSAEGSMRDAESALDQVIAFAGQKISSDDVATVLGLVGRDLVLDIVTAVADETPAAAFELSGRAVELGYDLRLVVREVSRVVRDLLVLSVDPARIEDPEIAAESERARLQGLAGRFSREDLLRAFDVLSKAEFEIRTAVQPRYHLEMSLLRWIHLRKLVPLTELLGSLQGGSLPARPAFVPTSAAAPPPPPLPSSSPAQARVPRPEPTAVSVTAGDGGKDVFLSEIRKGKIFFYNTVVAQAQRIEFGADRVTFTFLPAHRTLREQLEQNRAWLESLASAAAGRKMTVGAAQAESAPAAVETPASPRPVDLKTVAMDDAAVQAMLDVFPAEIEDVEEI
ncbi:MAG: DNA polymerase III subunit gamma/tau [Vicinamibacterales bacterium]|nr:DNA polymerase III subunit gamma/tau [Vicinamibacterales bacterium]